MPISPQRAASHGSQFSYIPPVHLMAYGCTAYAGRRGMFIMTRGIYYFCSMSPLIEPER